jgi:hypothetical protein
MLRQDRDFSTIDAGKRGTTEAGKNSVIYTGLILGPNKADDACGKTTVTGTMERGFTVLPNHILVFCRYYSIKVPGLSIQFLVLHSKHMHSAMITGDTQP